MKQELEIQVPETRADTKPGMKTIAVGLGNRGYDILIGYDLLSTTGTQILSRFGTCNIAVVTDENVGALYSDALETALETAGARGPNSFTITIPAGETSKSYASLELVTEKLLDGGIERGDLIIALGGGVVGDLAGFAAGILRRGIRFVQIPTSLLAQVDSSVGGKTGINTSQGKNLIGLFHQPSLVLADVSTLETLPERELRAGYGEVVKYGLISDAPFFRWLENNGANLLAGNLSDRAQAISTCCNAKAKIVASDERETGPRALLNLGHTFGHALETATGYDGRLLHGEGVAIGMVLAAKLSAALGLCPPDDASRIEAHLKLSGLPTKIDDIPGEIPSANGLIELMAQDKKVRDGRLTFILLKGIGKAFSSQKVSADRLLDFVTAMHGSQ